MRALFVTVLILAGCAGSPRSAQSPAPPGNTAAVPATPDESTASPTEKAPQVAIAEDPCQGGQATGAAGGDLHMGGGGGPVSGGSGGGLAGIGGGGQGGGTGAGGGHEGENRPSTVHYGETTVSAGLDPDVVRPVVKARVRAIKACYEKGLKSDPSLTGKLLVDFTIGADGSVTEANASGLNPEVDACVSAQFKRMTFPAPTGGSSVRVVYPLVFAP